MSLTDRERRALRAIDNALSEEDPALAALLSGPPSASSARWVRRLAGAALALSLVLLLFGLVLSDPGVWFGGLLLLLVAPPTLWCVATAIDADS